MSVRHKIAVTAGMVCWVWTCGTCAAQDHAGHAGMHMEADSGWHFMQDAIVFGDFNHCVRRRHCLSRSRAVAGRRVYLQRARAGRAPLGFRLRPPRLGVRTRLVPSIVGVGIPGVHGPSDGSGTARTGRHSAVDGLRIVDASGRWRHRQRHGCVRQEQHGSRRPQRRLRRGGWPPWAEFGVPSIRRAAGRYGPADRRNSSTCDLCRVRYRVRDYDWSSPGRLSAVVAGRWNWRRPLHLRAAGCPPARVRRPPAGRPCIFSFAAGRAVRGTYVERIHDSTAAVVRCAHETASSCSS